MATKSDASRSLVNVIDQWDQRQESNLERVVADSPVDIPQHLVVRLRGLMHWSVKAARTLAQPRQRLPQVPALASGFRS